MNGNDLNSKYLTSINTIIQFILDSTSIVSKYNDLHKICLDNVVVNKKWLNQIIKSNFKSNEKYYLLPKDKIKRYDVKLCNNISNKYLKILKLITFIKYIYDTENVGKNNFATLIFNHIQVKDNIIKLKSCITKQNKWWWETEEGFNLLLIHGLKEFVENILTDKEVDIFIGQLKHVLKSKNYTKLHKYVCKDDLIKDTTYEKLYKTVFYCKNVPKGGNNKYLINIQKHNPIFSKNMCKTETIYQLKYMLQFKQMIDNMQNNYIKNLKKIESLIELLIFKENNNYKLKDISYKTLNNIEHKIKRTVILFYMQSLIDYKNVLNTIRLYR